MQHVKLLLLAVLVARCAFYVEGSPKPTGQPNQESDEFLTLVDQIMELGSCDDFKEAQRLLLEHRDKYGENSRLLWRMARSYFLLSELNCANPKTMIHEGLEYAKSALRCNEKDAFAHKWFAILSAMKAKHGSISEKLLIGKTFSTHLERAITLQPKDHTLHQTKGIFLYQLGKLPSYARKMASLIFPKTDMKDAIEELRLARNLKGSPWKMNSVWLAKCYIHQGNLQEAKNLLDAAKEVKVECVEDRKAEEEITSLQASLKRMFYK